MATPTTTTIPFVLRGIEGSAAVENGPNEDPVRWGYDVLGIYAPELARGFPVTRARFPSWTFEDGWAAG